jgi:hypothetical protein
MLKKRASDVDEAGSNPIDGYITGVELSRLCG